MQRAKHDKRDVYAARFPSNSLIKQQVPQARRGISALCIYVTQIDVTEIYVIGDIPTNFPVRRRA
jgi:hypothetical protein